MELYGGAQLVFPGLGTTIQATTIVGDDTGYIHVGPGQTIHLTEVRIQVHAPCTFNCTGKLCILIGIILNILVGKVPKKPERKLKVSKTVPTH